MSVRVETEEKSVDLLIDKNVYECVFRLRSGTSVANKPSLVDWPIR